MIACEPCLSGTVCRAAGTRGPEPREGWLAEEEEEEEESGLLGCAGLLATEATALRTDRLLMTCPF
jgi:hypothetical protein